MEYILLIVSLTLIIVGAMILTDGSVALAHRLRVPEFIVGLTVVALGTSMPEFVVSLLSALKGSGEMAIGNVVGSNTFNVFAILGICALFKPINFTKSNIRRDIPICVLVSFAFLIVTFLNNDITRIEGAILLLGYILMVVLTTRADRRAMAKMEQSAESESVEEGKVEMSVFRMIIWIIGGLGALIYGGQLCVDSATTIARNLGVSEATIAITLVAGGTSLPELASSLVSLLKGRASLALGNVLGSNIANILLILGGCSLITPLSMGNVTMIDICVAVAAPVVVMLSALLIGHNKMTRFEGLLLLVCYVAYVYSLI